MKYVSFVHLLCRNFNVATLPFSLPDLKYRVRYQPAVAEILQ